MSLTTPKVDSFYTVVRNIYGSTHRFDFLGKHGHELAANEQFSEPGNLIQKVAYEPRKFDSLQRAVKGYVDEKGNAHPPSLAIISLPGLVFYDATAHNTKSLSISGGSVTVGDPDFGAHETALTATFAAITTPTASPVASEVVTFSQIVTGFDGADLTLTKGGTNVPLNGVTITTSNNKAYTINGLSSLTGTAGVYVLKITAAGCGILDIDGNTLTSDVTVTWTHS
jgi:hypothetical protein